MIRVESQQGGRMVDRQITTNVDEVFTRGGYHVGYVYRYGDGAYRGRGVGPVEASRSTKLAQSFPTKNEAAEALIGQLKSAGMFDYQEDFST